MIILKYAVYVHPLPGQDEDTYLIRPLGAKNLYLVFDGVGGHKNGREAADLAKSHFAQAEIRDKNDIIDVILAADADIQMFLEDSFTTITGVLQDSGKGYAFSVGDSPFLHFNPGKQKLYQMLAPHYAKNSTSTLVKALGYGLKPEDIRTREFRFFSGHWYLLASDGL
ncbi:MAG: hypothetical protein GY731_20335, partial [Gammaproteobacteria bacterium]|nr:hypothetical protein [Gammaproteobacteria bacterium]